MTRLLKLILLAPAAFALIVFAVANRHSVKVSLDPFGSADTTALTAAAPLFVLLIAAAMFGVVCGSAASWFAHGKYRKAARASRAETTQLRADALRLQARQGAGQAAGQETAP